jgi:hypothetical protein
MYNLFSDPIFQALFNSPVPRIIVKADAPVFTIVANNDAHRAVTNLKDRDITGKSVFEVFDPEEAGGNGGDLLLNALKAAQESNQTVLMPPFRYDMPSSDQTTIEVKWWQLEIMPIGTSEEKPEFLLTTTYNITEETLKKQFIEENQKKERLLNEELAAINEELAAMNEEFRAAQEELQILNDNLEEQVLVRTKELSLSEAKFRTLVEQSPVAIALLAGREHIVDAVNPAMLKIWDKQADVSGKPIVKALPEMEGQPYPEILNEVFKTGVPFYGNESEVMLLRNGVLDTGYFNFSNYPVKDTKGHISGIIIVANEVTQQVLARRKIEENERNLHTLIMKARYPLMILRGREWVIEIANQGIADLWAMPLGNITGRKLLDVLPGIIDQPFPALLTQVFNTGVSYGQEEEVFFLETPTGTIAKYISFYYDPILEDGNVTGIIVTAQEISEFVNARKELERVYEQANLSKQAAELGLFDMDPIEGTMVWDTRCRELFGITHEREVSFENDFIARLHEDDKERVSTLVSQLFDRKISNGDYDVEYRTIGVEDEKLRWVRAKGKVFFNDKDEAVRFIGSVLDITDKKLEEERKNDFIGMVSHELKTPLTSIQAYVQMLRLRASKQDDQIAVPALLQTEKQVKKMANMINGFLNVSRLESGNLHLFAKDFNINKLISAVINEVRLTVTSHKIVFVTDTDELTVQGDEDKMEHVISNLLSNAIKYSGEGAEIEIKTEKNDHNVIVSVKDSGIGIEDKNLEKLFSRFYRVEAKHTKYISGFGIGLYLCAEIIRLHKGNIWVESEIGEGSVFSFSIPLR